MILNVNVSENNLSKEKLNSEEQIKNKRKKKIVIALLVIAEIAENSSIAAYASERTAAEVNFTNYMMLWDKINKR